jgi:signal transduction histidine kinase
VPNRRHHEHASLPEDFCSQLGSVLDPYGAGFGAIRATRQAELSAVIAIRQKQLAEASELAKTSFLANMSHELRTPLNAIIGFSEIIEQNATNSTAQYPAYIGHIHNSAMHLLKIIDEVLDISGIEAGRVELKEGWIGLSDAITAAIAATQPLSQEKGISVEPRPGVGAQIRVDPTKFNQILLNLLSNAIKFTEPSGRVTVAFDPAERGGVVIAVTDTGIGIPRDRLEKVMEAFEQVEDHLTRRHDGTGLGLPIAKALVELHGGSLHLTSEINKGTTAEFRLPRERVRLSL